MTCLLCYPPLSRIEASAITEANHERDDWIDGEKTEDLVAFLDRLYTAKRQVEHRIVVLGGEEDSVRMKQLVQGYSHQMQISETIQLSRVRAAKVGADASRRPWQSQLALLFYGVHGSSQQVIARAVLAYGGKF